MTLTACGSGPSESSEPTKGPTKDPTGAATSNAPETSTEPDAPAPREDPAELDVPALPEDPVSYGDSSAPTQPGVPLAAEDAGPAEDVQSACYAAAGDDACELCVCRECVSPLEDCAATPGCPEILGCVLESGCTGLDCYCGSEPLPSCLGAERAGNGPCRDVVLSAPGGRQPDLVNLSAGPASDSAIAVSTCATAEQTCGAICPAGEP